MIIIKDVTTIVKNFLLNYAEVYRLLSSVRNINHIIQSIIFLPIEMSYKFTYHKFLASLEKDNTLCALKYNVFHKL